MMEIPSLNFLPYLFLFLSVVISFRSPKSRWVPVGLTLALVAGFFTQVLSLSGFLGFVVCSLTLFAWVNHFLADFLRKFGFLIFLVLACLLVSHCFPGVNNVKILDSFVMADGGFDVYLHFDKVFLAVLLLYLLSPMDRQKGFRASYSVILYYYVVTLLVLLPLMYFTGFHHQWNSSHSLILWAVNHFFFVSFSDEIIFRRFIQNSLVHYFRNVQYGDLVAIFMGALIFGLAHWGGGIVSMGLAAVTGFFYGLCFYHTCNFRVSMALHFLISFTHVLCFTNPPYII